MAEEKNTFWSSGANVRWTVFALTVVALHILIRHTYPAFTPPKTNKPEWIKFGLESELFVHLAVFGAAITGIQNAIPSWRKPHYTEDGTLSLNSPQCFEPIRWSEIGCIVLELVIYFSVWALIYGII